MCVSSVRYSIQVNDEEVGPILLGRGLRQGDPLSPYLFILCAEGLTSLIKDAERSGTIHGVSICIRVPVISHLLFADDSFLFMRSAENEFLAMKDILSVYEKKMRPKHQKSEVIFSSNVPQASCQALANILGVTQRLGAGKYLGLPSLVGRNRKTTFSFIKDRVWDKISSWKSKTLSMAGREVLIKSVVQATLSYYMSMYLIPPSLGDEIQRMMNSFFWGSSQRNNRGINWLDWDKLTIPKKFGGMGFRNIYAFNLAMLAKQAWKFIDCPDALVSRIFKARYYPNCDFLDAKLGPNPSYCWRSLWLTQNLLKEGTCWCIGSGHTINVIGSPWLCVTNKALSANDAVAGIENLKVNDLWLPGHKKCGMLVLFTCYFLMSKLRIF